MIIISWLNMLFTVDAMRLYYGSGASHDNVLEDA